MYKKDPGFSDKASSLFMLDLGSPEKLPDALRGEKWSFVQLPLSALQQELRLVEQVSILASAVSHFVLAGLPDTCCLPHIAVTGPKQESLYSEEGQCQVCC